ncbi:hypothetical protein GPECTOR_6g774 [Gonium pectorale]|uniref:Protein kinase domain-containing protein n=1 Tax=Gonium pectorale TaxID=33097 RepID=A0A150GVE6_GONPE|nr:hypothetical protein GPECTOR_6g774 [Gonium pectorale]|eukprot:KXZ53856.1 hypothetical protein GPECTOR_6g774 [Gonium pectorale]
MVGRGNHAAEGRGRQLLVEECDARSSRRGATEQVEQAQLSAPLRAAARPMGREVSQVTMLQMLHFGSATGQVPLHHLASLNLGALSREIHALHWVGQGGGGAVFQGVWQGAPVAVKFMLAGSPAHVDATALEAIVSLAVGHPNVVSTYAFDVARVTDASLMETLHDMYCSHSAAGSVDDTVSATALYNALMGSYAVMPESVAAATAAASPQMQHAQRSRTASRRQLQLLHPSTMSGSFTAGTGCGGAMAGLTGAAYGAGAVADGGAGSAALRASFARIESLGVRMQRAQAAAAAAAGGPVSATVAIDGEAAGSGGPSPEQAGAPSVAGSGGAGPSVASRSGNLQRPEEGLVSTFFSEEGFGEPDPASNTRAWSVRQVLQYMKARPGMYLTHIIMEYCDRGSLLAAIKRGIFRMDAAHDEPGPGSSSSSSGPVPAGAAGSAAESGSADAPPRFSRRIVLRAMLRTARDVAQGMCHLHANGIIHGDLKPGNVLLRGCRTDRRGFTALVSDFGLSKVTRGDKPLELNHWSTVTVMAPEVIMGRWLKASDVFSFGVLLWQLVAGETMPYGKRTVQQILLGVAQGTLKPEWPPSAHPALVRLGRACLATSPEDRPSFAAIVKVLTKIEQNVREELRLQRTSAARGSSSGPIGAEPSAPRLAARC